MNRYYVRGDREAYERRRKVFGGKILAGEILKKKKTLQKS